MDINLMNTKCLSTLRKRIEELEAEVEIAYNRGYLDGYASGYKDGTSNETDIKSN